MKKRFLLFCGLVFFFNMNCCYAEKQYFYFNYSESQDELLLAVCNSSMGCRFECQNGNTGAGTYNDVRGMCTDGTKTSIKKYALNRKDNLSDFKSFLQSTSCNNDGSCFLYVRDKYCAGKKNDSLCNQLNENASKPTKEVNGKYLNCTIDVQPYSDSSSDKSSFQIALTYDTKNKSLTPTFVNSGATDYFSIEWKSHYMTGLKNKFYFYAKGSNYKSDSQKIISSMKDGKCPSMKFCLEEAKTISGYYTWWLELKKCDTSKYNSGIEQSIDSDGSNSGAQLNSQATDWGSKLFKGKNLLNISDCKDLLGGENSTELIDLLKSIVTIVKVMIPLILITLGSLDFAKAIFSNEDSMKKCQKKFIQRIIIAIVIFLIPSLLKVLLTLANSVWGNISSDFCGIL